MFSTRYAPVSLATGHQLINFNQFSTPCKVVPHDPHADAHYTQLCLSVEQDLLTIPVTGLKNGAQDVLTLESKTRLIIWKKTHEDARGHWYKTEGSAIYLLAYKEVHA